MYDALLYGSVNLAGMAFNDTSSTLFQKSATPVNMFFKDKDACYVTDEPTRYCYVDGDLYYMVGRQCF